MGNHQSTNDKPRLEGHCGHLGGRKSLQKLLSSVLSGCYVLLSTRKRVEPANGKEH